MTTYLQASAAAGFASMMGRIKETQGTKLDIPDGQINIGGNGNGLILQGLVNFDPAHPDNHDGSFSTLALGDDIYIYACQTTTGRAKIVCSKNSTYPTGYSAITSRKIGGFHFGRVRPISKRFDLAYSPVEQIVPNAVWDFQVRPKSDPTGMAEVIPGSLWVDIYLNSEGAGTWPETMPVSKFGVMPVRNLDYAVFDFARLARNAGKRQATPEEFLIYADGSPQGSADNNDFAWSKSTNTGPANTGSVAKAISQYNIVDCAGNLWESLSGMYDLGLKDTYGYRTDVVQTGKDGAELRGEMYTYNNSTNTGGVNGNEGTSTLRCFAAGGRWRHAELCGPATLHSGSNPWRVNGHYSLRGVSDSL